MPSEPLGALTRQLGAHPSQALLHTTPDGKRVLDQAAQWWRGRHRPSRFLGDLAPLADGQKAINPNPLHDTTGSGDSFQKRMASAWKNFEGRILLLLSGDDYTAKEFLEYIDKDSAWRDAFTHPHLARHDLPGADHTFSSAANRAKVEDLTLALVRSIRPS